jgi:UPF0755 protein
MKKNRPIGRLIFHFFISISLTAICIFGSIVAFNKGYQYALGVMNEAKERKENPNIRELNFTLTETTSIEEISEWLYENDFISHKNWFVLQAKFGSIDKKLRPGSYSVTSSMSNDEILALLSATEKEQAKEVKFTIPEGFTIVQIANRLDAEGIVTKEDFLKAVNEREYDYAFLKDIPKETKYKLEGYLFPDTYIVREGASAEEVIIRMLNRFESIISQYTQFLHNSPYSLHELLAVASIIEQEARLAEERPIIAGVIYNRLDANMKLQMCSTVQYVLEKRKANLSYDDLEVESPYNTYKYDGLPVGPICAPGEDSILAALSPEENPYYFFVLKDATSGAHAFGRDGAEHEYNKLRYQQTVDKNFHE